MGMREGPCGYRLFEDRWAAWRQGARAVAFDARSLALARNFPYACCGYTFKTEWLRQYFEKQDWYCPSSERLPQFPEFASEAEQVVRTLKAMEEQARTDERKRPRDQR